MTATDADGGHASNSLKLKGNDLEGRQHACRRTIPSYFRISEPTLFRYIKQASKQSSRHTRDGKRKPKIGPE